jgi:hypothetical protein
MARLAAYSAQTNKSCICSLFDVCSRAANYLLEALAYPHPQNSLAIAAQWASANFVKNPSSHIHHWAVHNVRNSIRASDTAARDCAGVRQDRY